MSVSPSPSSVEIVEPLDGVFPEAFLQEISTNTLINSHIVIGLPDNKVIPSLDFSDFCELARLPPSWAKTCEKIDAKYISLAKNPQNIVAQNFLTKLSTHKNNKNASKSILLCPGRWENFSLREAFALGAKILEESKFSVFISVIGHHLTTLENAHELNPHLCGNSSFSEVESRYLFSSPVGLGDLDISGNYDFDLARNQKQIFLLKLRFTVKFPGPKDQMFIKPTPFSLISYKSGPTKATGSEISDQYVLASVVKGEKKFFDSLPSVGVNVFSIPDPNRVCPLFQNVQLYSQENFLSKDSVVSLLELSQGGSVEGKDSNPFFGKGICLPSTLTCPCAPVNSLRIIKLGKMDSIRNIEHRTAPFLLLQSLHLVSEIFPLSSFYYKVRLAPSVTDDVFVSTIRNFNSKLGDGGLFHSFYNGSTSTLFTLPPLLVFFPSVPRSPRSRLFLPSLLLRTPLSS